ncbi:MAG: 50S ribosomal protein L25 [bacterium]|nr:50S ribosomal protein L25 [bacterium]
MTKRQQLKAEERKITGKQVKQLRKEGILPASIYGKKVKSGSIQLNKDEFIKLYRKTGETAIIDILVGESDKAHHVLVRELQKTATTGKLLHVSFQEVDLTEKIEAEIPVRLEGESPAVKEKLALLLQELNEITVVAAADSLPEEIKIDISKLKASGDSIYIKDIVIPQGVEIKNDPEIVVVRLDELVAPESEELPEPETTEGRPEEDTESQQQEGEEQKTDEKVSTEEKLPVS